MKIILLIILIICMFSLNSVESISVVSSDLSLSTPACEGRPEIQEWIKQRKPIPIKKGDVLMVTISNKFNDDLKRLINSAEIYDQPYVILALCEQWNGENLVQHFLETIKQNKEVDFDQLTILYTDQNNIFVNSPQKLKEIFADNFPEGSIVFKAERYCFPRKMESQFKSTQTSKYLNSQAYFGPAKELLRLFGEIPFTSISDSFLIDYQSYFVNSYLSFKNKFNIRVDSSKKIFASLLGKDEKDTYQIRSQNDINTLVWRSSDSITNEMSDSNPILIGDIPVSFIQTMENEDESKKDRNWVSSLKKEDSKVNKELIREIRSEIDARFEVHFLQNFFPSTLDHPSSLDASLLVSSSPQSKKVMIGLFLNENDIFVRLLLEGIENLDFPKENISFFVNYYSKDSKKENSDLQQWLEKVEKEQGTPGNYALVIKRNEKDVSKAKREALLSTLENKCDFYFTTDAVLENKDTLNHLINEKKRFISPLITLHQSTFSNFWGQINWEKQGFGKHPLYQSIVDREYKGVLRVPIVWGTFLVDSSLIPQISENYGKNPSSKLDWESLLNRMESFKADDDWWADVIFSIKTSFEIEDGIWISNKEHFGLLIDKDEVTPEDNEKFDNENGKLHKELYAYPNNKLLFKKYYYNPDFYDYVVNHKKFNYTEPCIDAFAWEMMRPFFGEHLIEEAENYGKWSGGGHNHQYDPRIGGTENYPTQDIHLNQFGLHEIWLDIIMTDVATSADDLYGGIQTKGINIAFIVRYKPGHQASLKPHHDSSLYTISVALNKPGRDFQGGGVRYVRRNCTVINPDAGYAVVHPGRVTHKHEGLETTDGTRYIFVTFVN